MVQGVQTTQQKVWSTSPQLKSALGSKLASVDVQVSGLRDVADPAIAELDTQDCSSTLTKPGSLMLLLDLQATQQDTDFDGITDIITVQASTVSSTPIHGIKLLMQFNYGLQVGYCSRSAGCRCILTVGPIPSKPATKA